MLRANVLWINKSSFFLYIVIREPLGLSWEVLRNNVQQNYTFFNPKAFCLKLGSGGVKNSVNLSYLKNFHEHNFITTGVCSYKSSMSNSISQVLNTRCCTFTGGICNTSKKWILLGRDMVTGGHQVHGTKTETSKVCIKIHGGTKYFSHAFKKVLNYERITN